MELPQLSLTELAWSIPIPFAAATLLWLPLAFRTADRTAPTPEGPAAQPLALSTRKPASLLAALTSPLALAVPFLIGYWALEPRDPFPPAKSLNFLYYLTYAVAALALVEALLRHKPVSWKLPLWLLAIALPLWFITRSLRLRTEADGGPPPRLYLLLALTTLTALAWRSTTDFTLRHTPKTTLFILGILTAASAALIGITGSHVAPFRTGTLALALLPPLLILLGLSLFKKTIPILPTPFLTLWAAILPALLLGHNLYSELTTTELLLLAPAPLLPALIPPSKTKWPWVLARILLALTPIALALTLALLKLQQDSAASGEVNY